VRQPATFANDHYWRYKEDVKIMKILRANAHRLSTAWPRVFPSASGQPNPKGFDFYADRWMSCS
jgi:beta-glucosidase